MARIRTALFALALGAVAEAAVLHNHLRSSLAVEYDPTKKQDSTADPQTCTHIYFVCMVGLISQIVGYYAPSKPAENIGNCVILIGAAWAVGYAVKHGIMSDYWEGGHNLTEHCGFVGLFGIIMCIELAVVAFCLGGVAVVVGINALSHMNDATLKKSATLSPEDQKYLESTEFLAKCTEAFKKADKNGDGKLDLAELQDVVLFDLSPEQQKKVKGETLFKQAFEQCDANHDNAIDPDEFVVVMKFVRSHAMDPV